MPLQAVDLIYTTPDLPGPVLIPMMVVSNGEYDTMYDLRARALIIAEVMVQTTLQEYGVRAAWEEDDEDY